MGKSKLKLAGKLAKGIGKTALGFVPGGNVVKGALGLASKFGGSKGAGAGMRKRRRKGAMYYLKRIPIEKAKAKLIKIKMSAYKGL